MFFNQHHNEKRDRFKVRFRKYDKTNKLFFEIKKKNNQNRTIKNRISVKKVKNDLEESEMNLVTKTIDKSLKKLSQKLIIEFNRITLANNSLTERLTIDINLSVKNGTEVKLFDQLVITEIKQNKYNPKSDFIQILREMKIPEMRFSKYCMGILHIYKKIKYNRFKPKLTQIDKILNKH